MSTLALASPQSLVEISVSDEYSTFSHDSTLNSDAAHATSGLVWAATAARTVQSQGGDMYSLVDNALLKGAEYAAKFNMNESVSYDPSFYRCQAVLVDGPWAEISSINKGLTRPVLDILYYQYIEMMGIDSSPLQKVKDTAPPERHFTSGDLPSWGDLIWAYSEKNGSSNSTV